MTLKRSWIDSANTASTDFPLNNLPYGVFSSNGKEPRCGVAIGEMILDLTALEAQTIINCKGTLQTGSWNAFMASGKVAWAELRSRLTHLLSEDNAERDSLKPFLTVQADASLHMPFTVAEFTDFYAGRHHATNVGTMFRGAENALPPNWLHIPIGYNGRASSVVVSGTPLTRPHGQLKSPDHDMPAYLPSRRFDFELEMGAIIGTASDEPLSVDQAFENIFGYVLLNDWSARDIQAWEYQPLGPFQAKATATSISPWIVTAAALEPFRVGTPEREVELLRHLADTSPMLYDISLEVGLTPENSVETIISGTNYKEMYYSSAQQLAHHTSSGCPMRVGDLLGSGTISGPEKHQRGSLLELSWGGREPVPLDGGATRTFIEDGDSISLRGFAPGNGYRIGFGRCDGKVAAARDTDIKTR